MFLQEHFLSNGMLIAFGLIHISYLLLALKQGAMGI
jgi:hypothetical protein